MMKNLILATTIACLIGGPALAGAGTLQHPRGGSVAIWKNTKAMDEAMDIASSGATNEALLDPLISCDVPSGTPAITTSAGFTAHDVLVTGGSQSGCRGTVPVEYFHRVK